MKIVSSTEEMIVLKKSAFGGRLGGVCVMFLTGGYAVLGLLDKEEPFSWGALVAVGFFFILGLLVFLYFTAETISLSRNQKTITIESKSFLKHKVDTIPFTDVSQIVLRGRNDVKKTDEGDRLVRRLYQIAMLTVQGEEYVLYHEALNYHKVLAVGDSMSRMVGIELREVAA